MRFFRGISADRAHVCRHDLPRRAYQSPRPNIGVPRSAEPAAYRTRPPPPSVEDEEESLAREHQGSALPTTSDEEPKHRGDIDQQPILLLVHEHNPERRFVIVPNAGGEDAPAVAKERYQANTCRKYVLVTPEKATKDDKEEEAVDSDKNKTPGLGRRKSHQDLPRLTTDLEHTELAEPSIRRSSSRRGREKPVVDQEPQDYPERREKAGLRLQDDEFLSPATVRQTAGKRDRAYWDFNAETNGRAGRSPSSRRHGGIEVSDRRRPHHSPSGYPSAPAGHQRASSTTSMPIGDDPPPERPSAFTKPYGLSDPAEIFAYMSPGDDFKTGRQDRDDSPRRRTRNSNSPPYPRGAREMPGPSPNRRRQARLGTRDREGYSSDEGYRERRPDRVERPYTMRSALEPEYPSLLSPDQLRQPTAKLEPPFPSLEPSLASQFAESSLTRSPRSSTFPADKSNQHGGRSASLSPPTSTSPSRRPIRSNTGAQHGLHSRDASVTSISNGSGSLPPPVAASLGRTNGAERRPLPAQAASLARQESMDLKSPVPYWQLDEREDADNQTTPSIGRYSEDVKKGALPQLPDCRWTRPIVVGSRAGSDQFRILKRTDNFTVCPDCYEAVFENTEFQHQFGPSPARPGDQLVSCDFGSSHWYRIAYLMTLKHRNPDLRLLQGIASVAARCQPCGGSQVVTRTWYSMMGPTSRHPIQSFNVCLSCARTIEALLPNLAGVFVPLDSHEPTKGICELHFTPERKRFWEYFELMEATSDEALRRRMAPDVAELADRVREVSLIEECLRNTPVPNRTWHVMQKIPEFTVCEACFDDVVWPMVENEDSDVPRNFYKGRQLRQLAACQLYSKRMREVFLVASQYNDFNYLASHVRERLKTLAEVRARYNELQQEDQDDPYVQDELAALARTFKEVE